ncbi:MAG: TlpA disulfide reductase family protein [Thermodesulfovibrionia bacterium]|nr:TlpA disulfide reductase family protein [Thermodesulfovibrionia bacterium]
MKYKGLILAAVLVGAALMLLMSPENKKFDQIVAVGKPAPQFELMDSSGKMWKLSDLKGQVVLINFWATWCVTCKAEMNHKARLSEIMRGKPIQMFGVLYRDDPANLESYYANNNVTFATLIDPANSMSKLYGITGVPETFLIDKEGILRERFVGPQEWGNKETLATIEKWL